MNARIRQIRQRVIGAWAMLLCAMLVFVAYVLIHSRQDSMNAATDIARLHTASFEDFVTRTLQVTDLIAESALEKQTESPEAIAASLKGALLHTPFIRSISLVSGSGRITASSTPDNIGTRVDLAPFYPLQGGPVPFRIGTPWSGRDFAGGRPAAGSLSSSGPGFIPLVRSLGRAPSGISLLVALNPDYFVEHFTRRMEGLNAQVELLRYDGSPLIATRAPRSADQGARLLASLGLPDREFGEAQIGEGEHRTITSFRASSLYPLVVLTHIDREAAMAPMRHEAALLAAVLTPALVLVTLFALIYLRRHVQIEQQREQAERLKRINAASVFTNAREGIVIASPDGRFDEVNDAFTAITGYSAGEAAGQSLALIHPSLPEAISPQQMLAEASEHGQWAGELWGLRQDGRNFAALLTVGAVKDEGITRQFVMLFSDITALKEHEQSLQQIAYSDALTGLPNRALFTDRLGRAMARARRRDEALALAFIDLDGFKQINDQHGHRAGDELLRELAMRMKAQLRQSDTLARIGGDEFVAILPEQTDRQSLEAVLARLLDVSAQPVPWEGGELRVSASIGVALYAGQGDTADPDIDQLLRDADQAMYRAKLAGKGLYLFSSTAG